MIEEQMRRAIAGEPYQSWSAVWDRIIRVDRDRHAGMAPICTDEELLKFWSAVAAKNLDEAIDQFDALSETRGALRGSLDHEPFEGFRDTSDLSAFVIEWIENDQYEWIPLNQIRSLRVSEPDDLIEKVLRPAIVVMADKTERQGIMPMVYSLVGSAYSELMDGDGTDYSTMGDLTVGMGGRVWQVGDDDVEADSVRIIEFDMPGRVRLA